MLPVALDAMGGDKGPAITIEGARLATEQGIDVVLVGDPEILQKADTNGALAESGIEIFPASEVIPMDADPGTSVRNMKDSSLNRAAEAVRAGKASSLVSAGNTGATMAAALLKIGRIKGVARPAIGTPLPVVGREEPNLLLDSGANAECHPEWIAQFAKMGVIHLRDLYGIRHPRVGLMSIGEEPSKGNSLVKAAFQILNEPEWQKNLDCEFVGNVEGGDILGDSANVIVTDGFTGNVILKTAEGVASNLTKSIIDLLASLDTKTAEEVVQGLAPLYEKWNPAKTGGAVLLGVKGVAVISHGSASPDAIFNAIRLARDLVSSNTVEHLKNSIN